MAPGCRAGGTSGPHAPAISDADRTSAWRSAPTSAALTSPKCERAEYRPPMSGLAGNVRRNPCPFARFSSGVPGSVTATNREPSETSDQKCSKCESVSVVVPDLLAMTNSVRSRSMARCTARIWSGWVESSATRSSPRSATPNVSRNTSGARDDPPIPQSTAVRAEVVHIDLAHHGQPAQAVRDLGRVVAPHGVVAVPDPADDVLLRQDVQAPLDRSAQLAETAALTPHRATPLPPAPPTLRGTPRTASTRAHASLWTPRRPWPGAPPPRSSCPSR